MTAQPQGIRSGSCPNPTCPALAHLAPDVTEARCGFCGATVRADDLRTIR